MKKVNKKLKSLRKKMRGLFHLQARLVTVGPPATPQGIVRTLFEDAAVNYITPVKPDEVYTRDKLQQMFGHTPANRFKTITTANTFRS